MHKEDFSLTAHKKASHTLNIKVKLEFAISCKNTLGSVTHNLPSVPSVLTSSSPMSEVICRKCIRVTSK